MSKNNHVLGILASILLACAGIANAQTVGELSEKNREYLLLSADVDLARKKNELKTELAGKVQKSDGAQSTAAGPFPGVAAATPGGAQTVQPVRAYRVPQDDIGLLSIKAVYGDEYNPLVEFTYAGEDRPAVRQGDMVMPFWRLRAVNGRAAVIERLDKNGKVAATRTLMLPAAVSPAPLSRYEVSRQMRNTSIPRLPGLGDRR